MGAGPPADARGGAGGPGRAIGAGEQILRATGEAHIAVIIERLKRKFGAAIVTKTPRVPYRETIRGKTQVHGRTRSRPAATGCSATSGSSSSRTPAAASSSPRRSSAAPCRELLPRRREGHPRDGRRGRARRLPAHRLQGDPLRRLVPHGRLERAVVQDRGLDGPQGRVQEAKPALLEPIMAVEVRVPEQFMGEVNRDLNGRRGRVLGMDTRRRDAGRDRPRAAVGAVQLRDRAAVADRRARHVPAELDHYDEVPSTSPRRSSRHTARTSRPAPLSRGRPARYAAGRAAPAGSGRHPRQRRTRRCRWPPEVEPALVERPADDRPGAAQVADRAEVVDGRDPPEAIDASPVERDQAASRSRSGPPSRPSRSIAVTSNVVDADVGQADGPPPRPPGAPSPALAERLTVAHVDRHRIRSAPWPHEPRREAGSRRAAVPKTTRAAPRRARRRQPSVRRPPPPRRAIPDRRDDPRRRAAARAARARAVQVHDVDRRAPGAANRATAAGSSPYTVSRSKSPSLQPDHATAAQVDRRHQLEAGLARTT